VESRGIAQRAGDWQNSIKLHHDAQDDSTMLRTTPPMLVPTRRFGGKDGPLPVSPFCQVPYADATESYSFLTLPGNPLESGRIQGELRSESRRYFGLADETVPSTVTQMHQQKFASSFLAALGEAINMTFEDCQQYMDPIVGARIAGMAVPLNVSREEIQGHWQTAEQIRMAPRHAGSLRLLPA